MHKARAMYISEMPHFTDKKLNMCLYLLVFQHSLKVFRILPIFWADFNHRTRCKILQNSKQSIQLIHCVSQFIIHSTGNNYFLLLQAPCTCNHKSIPLCWDRCGSTNTKSKPFFSSGNLYQSGYARKKHFKSVAQQLQTISQDS